MKKSNKPDNSKYSMTKNENIAKRIQNLIGDIPIGTVAEGIGVSRQTLSNLINGRYKPDVTTIQKLADYFNVTTDYVVGRTDIKSSDTSIKDMCAITNLNEEAIKALIYIGELHTKTLNKLILKGDLSTILNSLEVLERYSNELFEFNGTASQLGEYEDLKIDAIRYRASLSFNKILDNFDSRTTNVEEYEGVKETARQVSKEMSDKYIQELLSEIKKGKLNNGSD